MTFFKDQFEFLINFKSLKIKHACATNVKFRYRFKSAIYSTVKIQKVNKTTVYTSLIHLDHEIKMWFTVPCL